MISSLFYLQSNSQVWIVRAWHSNDAHLGLNAGLKHSHTGLSTKKYNKVMEAESTTVKNTASGMGLRVATYSCSDRWVLYYFNLGLSQRFARA